MKNKITVILAERQELFRKSLKALLLNSSQFEIIADVENGKEVIDTLKQKFCQVVLLDYDLPIMNGKAVLEVIKTRFPETRVIVLSSNSCLDTMSEFMSNGANCYLTKDCNVETLICAVETVLKEGYYFNKTMSQAMLETLIKTRDSKANGVYIDFNNREIEILRQICEGLTNKEIALQMHLSASTIDFHRTRIYSKVKCTNVVQLFKYALKNGLVAIN